MSSIKPPYADFDSSAKFLAIQGIIAQRLRQHPRAICSYSGGSDSDILIDLIERTRQMIPSLPPVKYVFFNTGLEMQATKDHVKATAEKYGVEIEEIHPKVNIIRATRKYGIPFMSKVMSRRMSEWQKRNIPLSIADEWNEAGDKVAKRQELRERYPKSEAIINFICGCTSDGKNCTTNGQMYMDGTMYMRDFINENPPDFAISAKCCECCKKQIAHKTQKGYRIVITGERETEGGIRTLNNNGYANGTKCFMEMGTGQYRLRPLYYVTDTDKAWYKEYYSITYSDAYEVYGLTRTGCCGCPISYKAVEDLKKIRPYEPNVVKAAWNIFGKSYVYRKKYNEYKEKRKEEAKSDNRAVCRSSKETAYSDT